MSLPNVNNSDNLIIFAASKIHKSCILSPCLSVNIAYKRTYLMAAQNDNDNDFSLEYTAISFFS